MSKLKNPQPGLRRSRVNPEQNDSVIPVQPYGYRETPFAGFDAGTFDATGHRGKWDAAWSKGRERF